jgi:prepilin-type N-terminal cleavage/methylation domain-containing protein
VKSKEYHPTPSFVGGELKEAAVLIKMKNRTKQSGLTIIEILVVVAVIAILVTITVGITSRVDTAIKERKTRAAIDLLATALEKYYQFHKEFPLIDKTDTTVPLPFVDKNYNTTKLKSSSEGIDGSINDESVHEDEYASLEGLYHCLSRTPNCRDIIEKIDHGLKTNKGNDGTTLLVITNNVTNIDYPLFRVNDAWKIPLRYTYNKANDSFPLIESAGPDKVFGDLLGTAQEKADAEDNITSRK